VQPPVKPAFDPHEFLIQIGPGKSVSQIRKNQVVFSQGRAADCIYYLRDGRIKLTVAEQGKEAVVAIIEPGQFFGEGCLTGQPVRTCTARAMDECEVTSITKDALSATLHDEPTLSELFIAYLLTRNSRIEGDLIDQLFNSSEKRLARLLLLLANFGENGNTQPIDVKITQETLAEMIGTTRSRVSYFMNRFRKLGFINYNGTIEVHRSLLNAVLNDKLSSRQADPI
jgi:CRP/FNR family transcriptional regulator, cyclic AMP receptor protein